MGGGKDCPLRSKAAGSSNLGEDLFEKLRFELLKLEKSLSKPVLHDHREGTSKSTFQTRDTKTREGSKTNTNKNGEKDEKNGFLECSNSSSPWL